MICIGIPATDYIRTQTTGTLMKLMRRGDVGFVIKQGPYVHANREKCVVHALNGGFTHLFFVDSDMVFESDVLETLLKRDKDIVWGSYNKRITSESIAKGKGLFKTDIFSGGCSLIKTSVFKKIPQPWFFLGTEEKQEGEDIYFGRKAKESGFEIWCDATVKVGHLGEKIY